MSVRHRREPCRGSRARVAARTWLRGIANGIDIGPDGNAPERENYGDVLLLDRVRAPSPSSTRRLPAETRAEVLAKLRRPKRRRWSTRTGACTATWSRACRSRCGAPTAPSAASRRG